MKIAANLNVLDEVELIEPCIRHLRAIGVDLIVLTDLGSIDGTTERLEEFERDPDICQIRLRRDEDPWGFPERMYQKTVTEFAPDRILFLDADEFWLPRSGNIKETASLAQADALSVRRLNVPLVAGQPVLPVDFSPAGYEQLHVVANPLTGARGRLEQDPDASWIMTEIVPKTLVDPRKVDGVIVGAHGVVKTGGNQPNVVTPDDLMIAHFPFSTADRFLRKLANIDRSLKVFGHRLKGAQAWHWRRWVELAEKGKGEEEFRRQILTPEAFQEAVAKGMLQTVESVVGRTV